MTMPSALDMLLAADLPPVDDAADSADLLVAIAHRACPDKRRFGKRYWDALAERVRAGTYTGLTLRSWWRRLSTDLGIDSPWPVDTATLVALLDGGQDPRILRILREDTATVVLRVRLAVAAAKDTSSTTPHPIDLEDL